MEPDASAKSSKRHRTTTTDGRETNLHTDSELARLAQAGDADAFGELVQRHVTTCLKRAFSMLRNRSDAEDEVQNAFTKAFESLQQFRFEGTFSSWLCRIVQNQCLMRMRERRQADFVSVDVVPESSGKLELVNEMSSPEDELGSRQVDNLLRTQISRIPPLMRAVMLLRDIEELPIGAVAERLNLTVPAAKSRLMRARREMRSRLTYYCGRNAQQILSRKATYHRTEYTQVA